MRTCNSAKKHLLRERKKVLLLLILVLWPSTRKILNSGTHWCNGWHKACVSFLSTTFRVWSPVQAESKENLQLEAVVRLWYNTHDIALGANRKVETKGKAQSEDVDPGCTQRPAVQTMQQGWASEAGGLAV